MENPLKDRVAIVTGGSRGIGRGIARELARQGAAVVVNYVSHPGSARSIVEEIAGAGGRATSVRADVSDRAGVEGMVREAVDRFGGLDILVNNAGIDVVATVLDTTDEDWDRIFAVNAKGCFLCTQVGAKAMIATGRGGRIVNIDRKSTRLNSSH